MTDRIIKYGLLLLNGLLYLCFLLADLGLVFSFAGPAFSSILKYISICSVFAGAVYLEIKKKTVQTRILCAALAFTVFADYFLLFTEDMLPGLCSFCIVQIFYMYLTDVRFGIKKQRLGLSALIALGIFLLIWMIIRNFRGAPEPMLIAIVIFYAVLFVSNIILCIKIRHFDRFTIGMLLFFACDINVLLYNLPLFFSLGEGFRFFCLNIAAFLMWFFYLPGKILIVSSEL